MVISIASAQYMMIQQQRFKTNGSSMSCGAIASMVVVMMMMSLVSVMIPTVDASPRFQVIGPAVTVTLKDSISSNGASSPVQDEEENKHPNWGLDLNELKPNINWSIQSRSRPLPNWFPSLHSIRTNLGYSYEESAKYTPSYIESEINFSPNESSLYSPVSSDEAGTSPSSVVSTSKLLRGMNLRFQPSYEFRSKRGALLVHVSKGTSYILSQFTTSGKRWLSVVRGCYQRDLPFATIGAVRITPTYDFNTNQPTCTFEATTGSQRTKATLNLQKQNPTLSIVHAFDGRHVISPEISLYNARIVYQWNIELNSGSIRTKVDPTDAVYVTWTDKSMTGKWVTDVKFPLSGTFPAALAANIRVRRQFMF